MGSGPNASGSERKPEGKPDGPVLTALAKRVRAVKKKLNRITETEAAVSAGKEINADQQELLKAKPGLVAVIEELDKLHEIFKEAVKEELDLAAEEYQQIVAQAQVVEPPAPVEPVLEPVITPPPVEEAQVEPAVDTAAIVRSTKEKILELLYFSQLFEEHGHWSTLRERQACLTYELPEGRRLTDQDLIRLAHLGKSLITRVPDQLVSHKDALQQCNELADKWLTDPSHFVDFLGVPVSDLQEVLLSITSSNYYTATPIKASEVPHEPPPAAPAVPPAPTYGSEHLAPLLPAPNTVPPPGHAPAQGSALAMLLQQQQQQQTQQPQQPVANAHHHLQHLSGIGTTQPTPGAMREWQQPPVRSTQHMQPANLNPSAPAPKLGVPGMPTPPVPQQQQQPPMAGLPFQFFQSPFVPGTHEMNLHGLPPAVGAASYHSHGAVAPPVSSGAGAGPEPGVPSEAPASSHELPASAPTATSVEPLMALPVPLPSMPVGQPDIPCIPAVAAGLPFMPVQDMPILPPGPGYQQPGGYPARGPQQQRRFNNYNPGGGAYYDNRGYNNTGRGGGGAPGMGGGGGGRGGSRGGGGQYMPRGGPGGPPGGGRKPYGGGGYGGGRGRDGGRDFGGDHLGNGMSHVPPTAS